MESQNYDINDDRRYVECALSSAIATALPTLTGEQQVLQKNASGLVRTLQNAQNINIMGQKEIAQVANYALKGINKAKSELGTLKAEIPLKLFDEYNKNLNVIRESFIPYAN